MSDEKKAAPGRRRRGSAITPLHDMEFPRFVLSLLAEKGPDGVRWRTAVTVRGSPWTAFGQSAFKTEAEAVSEFLSFYVSEDRVASELREALRETLKADQLI